MTEGADRQVLRQTRDALRAVVELLQREAPGTPLNHHQFDQVGIDANNALAAADRALERAKARPSGKYRDRLLRAAIRLVEENRHRYEEGTVGDLDFLEAVDAIFEEQEQEPPWEAVIRWFELEYGYNPDPSLTPRGDVLRWALELRQKARAELRGG